MEAVAANALVKQFPRNCESRRCFRDRAVKCRIEAGKLRNTWVGALRSLDQLERDGYMQRREMYAGPQLFQDCRSDAPVRQKARAAMHHAMSDGGGFALRRFGEPL